VLTIRKAAERTTAFILTSRSIGTEKENNKPLRLKFLYTGQLGLDSNKWNELN